LLLKGVLSSDIFEEKSKHERLTIAHKIKSLNRKNEENDFEFQLKFITLPAASYLKATKYGKKTKNNMFSKVSFLFYELIKSMQRSTRRQFIINSFNKCRFGQ
jgi:hypothetical protein